MPVDLGDHQPAGGPDPFDGRRHDVDLDAEGDLAVAGRGGLHQDGVGRAHRVEQPRHHGQPHGEIVDARVRPDAGTDERGLDDDAVVEARMSLWVEHEDPVALEGAVEEPHQLPGVPPLPETARRGPPPSPGVGVTHLYGQ